MRFLLVLILSTFTFSSVSLALAQFNPQKPSKRLLIESKGSKKDSFKNIEHLNHEEKFVEIPPHIIGSEDEIKRLRHFLGAKPAQKANDALKICQNTTCVLDLGFGSQQTASLALHIAKNYGWYFSLSQHYNLTGYERIWSYLDLVKFERVLRALPRGFYFMNNYRFVYLIAQESVSQISVDFFGAGSSFAGLASSPYILLVEPNRGDSKFKLAQTFAHEIGHAYDFEYSKYPEQDSAYSLSFSESTDFLVLGWQPIFEAFRRAYNRRVYTIKRDGVRIYDGFPTTHAQTDPWEDFAESIYKFVFNRKELKEIARERHDFVETKVFEGRGDYYLLSNKIENQNYLNIIEPGSICDRVFLTCENRLLVNKVKNSSGDLIYRIRQTSATDHKVFRRLDSYEAKEASGCFSGFVEDLKSSTPRIFSLYPSELIELDLMNRCEDHFPDFIQRMTRGDMRDDLNRAPQRRPR